MFLPKNGVNLNGQRIQNVADAVAVTDAVTLQQLQNYLNGLAWKPTPVRVATTANGAIGTAYANGQTVDGVTLTTGMRILLKDQTTGTENGIYTVNASGAPTRATDADTTAELQNATVLVTAGTANSDKAFTQTANDPVIGTTSLAFALLPGSGSSYSAGNGISISANIVAVTPKSGGGIVVDGTGVSVDRTNTPSIVKATLAAASAGASQTVTHNLGTVDVAVHVLEVASGQEVVPDITRDTTNTVQINFATAISASAYRVVIIG